MFKKNVIFYNNSVIAWCTTNVCKLFKSEKCNRFIQVWSKSITRVNFQALQFWLHAYEALGIWEHIPSENVCIVLSDIKSAVDFCIFIENLGCFSISRAVEQPKRQVQCKAWST